MSSIITSLFNNDFLFMNFFSSSNIFIVKITITSSTKTENKAISICVTLINTVKIYLILLNIIVIY